MGGVMQPSATAGASPNSGSLQQQQQQKGDGSVQPYESPVFKQFDCGPCSKHGKCVSGKCVCKPGFYGDDCSLGSGICIEATQEGCIHGTCDDGEVHNPCDNPLKPALFYVSSSVAPLFDTQVLFIFNHSR